MEVVEKLFRLEAEEELRVEVDCGKTDKVTVELKSGHAEIFGTELVINTRFTLLYHSRCLVIMPTGQVPVHHGLEVRHLHVPGLHGAGDGQDGGGPLHQQGDAHDDLPQHPRRPRAAPDQGGEGQRSGSHLHAGK